MTTESAELIVVIGVVRTLLAWSPPEPSRCSKSAVTQVYQRFWGRINAAGQSPHHLHNNDTGYPWTARVDHPEGVLARSCDEVDEGRHAIVLRSFIDLRVVLTELFDAQGGKGR